MEERNEPAHGVCKVVSRACAYLQSKECISDSATSILMLLAFCFTRPMRPMCACARARRDMPVYKVIEIARRILTLEILVPGTPKCSPRILELENCRQVCVPSIDVQQGFDSSISLVLGEGESIWNSHVSYLSYMPDVSHMSYMSDMFSTSIGARDLFACSLLMNQISLCQPSGNFSLCHFDPLWP